MAQFRMAESLPPVVKNLLIANALVFLAQFVFEQQGIYLEEWGALWPLQSGNFKIWQLVTHMFMHGGLGHIFFNMFSLFMFGRYLENAWGPKRFFQFYMICGIMAGVTHLLLANGGAVGASGAIMGVLAAFAYLYPNISLYLFFIPIPIKAKWAIPGLMAIDLFGAVAPQMMNDNIAHWAHLGGAVAGLLLVVFWNRKNRKTFF